MHTDQNGQVRPHKNRHMFEKAENLVGVLMVLAIIALAIAFATGMLGSSDGAPSWMP